jgi:hypothetical protein
MAINSNTQTTYALIGGREDLSDIIYNVSPTETPFLSAIERVPATAVYHEWQTEELATPANNAQLEGDVAAADARTTKVRLGNYCQISRKVVEVSGTSERIRKAGRKSEMARELMAKGLEIKRDAEFAIMQNTTTVVGNNTTARQTRGLEGWVATNDSLGAGGASPVYTANPGTAPTDGTQRAYTETLLKAVLQLIYESGGSPDTVFLGSAQKQTMSGFSGNASRTFDLSNTKQNKLIAGYDVYVSDFGTLKVVPSRNQRSRTAFVLQTDMWKLAELRPIATEDLAKTGDSIRKLMTWEYALEACNEKSSGAVRDLS